MKFSATTLACLAGLAATAYSHPVTDVLEKRLETLDDDTFRTALKTFWTDLDVARQAVHKYDPEDYFSQYEYPDAAWNTTENLGKSTKEVENSKALSMAGVVDILLLYRDIGNVSKTLLEEIIARKPPIEAISKCGVSRAYTQTIWVASAAFARAIAGNCDPKAKEIIFAYAEFHWENLQSILTELERPKCNNANGRSSSQADL
ncbi:hypothetical protein VF21_09316 [Pseudogymnoascus sp. 05NY08]|nr:hypothetical protein VF21_09316 [Pseudogymnoascus sp. 05NY08]